MQGDRVAAWKTPQRYILILTVLVSCTAVSKVIIIVHFLLNCMFIHFHWYLHYRGSIVDLCSPPILSSCMSCTKFV